MRYISDTFSGSDLVCSDKRESHIEDTIFQTESGRMFSGE